MRHGNFKRLTAPLIFLVTILVVICGQAAAVARPSEGLLWEIKGSGTTVYLLGSLHVLTRDSYPLAEDIEAAYDSSELVAFETDLAALNSPEVQSQLLSQALLPPDEKMQDYLSEETSRALSHYLVTAGLQTTQFERLKPWMGALTISLLELQRLGFDPQLGVDQYFFSKAGRDGKETAGLEPIEMHIKLLTDLEGEDQDGLLRQTLTEIATLREMSDEMERAWQTGDAEGLGAIAIGQSFKEFPHLYQKLLVDRNRNWLPQIEKFLQGGKQVMVIVGAGHLVGEQGVPALLRAKGYEVVRK